MTPRVTFANVGDRLELRLGVVTVATVNALPDGGFCWAVHLPGLPSTARAAITKAIAAEAARRKILEWCEAAHLEQSACG